MESEKDDDDEKPCDLAAMSGAVQAEGPPVYYVSPVQPTLPSPEEARRMTDQTWALLAPIGRFHREALRRAWTGAFVDRAAPDTDRAGAASGASGASGDAAGG